MSKQQGKKSQVVVIIAPISTWLALGIQDKKPEVLLLQMPTAREPSLARTNNDDIRGLVNYVHMCTSMHIYR